MDEYAVGCVVLQWLNALARWHKVPTSLLVEPVSRGRGSRRRRRRRRRRDRSFETHQSLFHQLLCSTQHPRPSTSSLLDFIWFYDGYVATASQAWNHVSRPTYLMIKIVRLLHT